MKAKLVRLGELPIDTIFTWNRKRYRVALEPKSYRTSPTVGWVKCEYLCQHKTLSLKRSLFVRVKLSRGMKTEELR